MARAKQNSKRVRMAEDSVYEDVVVAFLLNTCRLSQQHWFSAVISSSLQVTNRSFTYASPYLWNLLPSSFRQPHSVHCNPGSPHPAHIT